MLYCEIGTSSAQSIDELAVFVSQLSALGVEVGIDVRSVPEGLHRNGQFDVAPYLVDRPLTASDRVVVISAERLTDQRLVELRRLAGRSGAACLAVGAFATHQATISIKAKLSYIFGRDPELMNLANGSDGPPDDRSGCPVFGVAVPPATGTRHLLLVSPALEELAQARALMALALSRHFRVAVMTDGKTKQEWIAAHGAEVPIYQYGDCLPASLAPRATVCALFSTHASYRIQSLVANLAAQGAALIDSTGSRAFSGRSDAFIPGPTDLTGLGAYLQFEILPNLPAISEQVLGSGFAQSCSPAGLLSFLGERRVARRPRRAREAAPRRIVFMPTNGMGLGHAQRCSLIAGELDPAVTDPVFAAFPSCMRLIKSHGFDTMPLISRSTMHAQSYENDLANYLRLRKLSGGAAALVFDGVYVFDSVYRTILENRLPGIWIRRGLWQPTQDNSIALDREKAFTRVIVPSEAFAELNGSYSHGDHLRPVGPIVRRIALAGADREALRQRLAARFGQSFERLVVSLLGGGVAADRSVQIQAICGMIARRPNTLHLVVVWPTATLQPGWFAWPNTRIVRTHYAGALAAAADLCISAAGYNSFHEMLYNGIPAIFLPQTGAFMDDQRARAHAASDRGLALTLEPSQLMTLDREVDRFLNRGEADAVRQRIAALDLPEPGNARAARLIEEVMHGCPALERDSRADHRPRRR